MGRLIALGVLAAAGAFAWSRLPQHQKRYLASILRQVPELPGRYAV